MMPLTDKEKDELILSMATAETILCDCAQELARALRRGRPDLVTDCSPRILYSQTDCVMLGLPPRYRG